MAETAENQTVTAIGDMTLDTASLQNTTTNDSKLRKDGKVSADGNAMEIAEDLEIENPVEAYSGFVPIQTMDYNAGGSADQRNESEQSYRRS